MKSSRASLRYAKATLSYAKKNSTVREVAKDMDDLLTIFTYNDTLDHVLKNPLRAAEKKQNIINALLPNASVTSKKLLTLILRLPIHGVDRPKGPRQAVRLGLA